MDSSTLTVIFSTFTGVAALVGSVLVARRYAQLGGGVAQEKLNELLRELNVGFEKRIAVLTAELAHRDRRIEELTNDLLTEQATRRRLQGDIDAMYTQLRELQLQGAKQEARDIKREARDPGDKA